MFCVVVGCYLGYVIILWKICVFNMFCLYWDLSFGYCVICLLGFCGLWIVFLVVIVLWWGGKFFVSVGLDFLRYDGGFKNDNFIMGGK